MDIILKSQNLKTIKLSDDFFSNWMQSRNGVGCHPGSQNPGITIS